jgi:hypothetical protein
MQSFKTAGKKNQIMITAWDSNLMKTTQSQLKRLTFHSQSPLLTILGWQSHHLLRVFTVLAL